jgi:hypothetical protein
MDLQGIAQDAPAKQEGHLVKHRMGGLLSVVLLCNAMDAEQQTVST